MNILKAVLSINPEAQLDVYEENIKTINWRGGTEPIPEAEIQAEMERLQAEYDALQYQRDRKTEYPSTADQLDYIYHNGIAQWKSDMVKPVKDAHPKP